MTNACSVIACIHLILNNLNKSVDLVPDSLLEQLSRKKQELENMQNLIETS